MKKLMILVLFAMIFLQSCVVYHKTAVPLSEAYDQGNVKVINLAGEMSKYKKIIKEDSIYYGFNRQKQRNDSGIYEWVAITMLLNADGVEAIYLRNARNTIYGSIGVGGVYYMTFNLYYERILLQKQVAGFVRTGYGSSPTYRTVILEAGILTGKSKSHLEGSIGINHLVSLAYEPSKIIPSGSIGYRFQRPGGGIVFRAGLGYPAVVYLGLGISF